MADDFNFNEQILLMARLQQKITEDEKSIFSTVTRIKTNKDAFKTLDQEIRDRAVENFTDTGDKKPHDAVWITHRNKRSFALTIEDVRENPSFAKIKDDKLEEAIEFLIRFQPDFIEPDHAKVEKEFRTGSSPFPFEEVEVPIVNVSKNLGEYVMVEEDDDF